MTRNNGLGVFTEVPGSPFNMPGSTNARGVAAGDLTGDGKLDVAVAHPGNRRVSVLAGNGAGGFAPAPGSPYSTEPVESPAGIAIGDFDRDLHPDLAIVHNENAARMSVLINDGSGRATFAGTDFGTGPVTPRMRTVTVANPGTGVLRVNGVGKPGDGYEVAADRCTGRTVVTGGACGIDVRFTGTRPRRAVSPLTIATQDGSFATTLNAVTRAPLLTRVGLSRKRFLVGKGRRRGTRVRFTLSEAVGVRIGFERAAAGRRSKGKCRKPTRRLIRARAKRCTRYVATKLVIRRNGKAGANSVAFTGKVGKRRLRPGAHRVVVVARDVRGNASNVARVGFTVRKPPAKRIRG